MKKNDLFILYNKSFMKNIEIKFQISDRVRLSKDYIPFPKGYKPQFIGEIIEISSKSTKKQATYTIKSLKKEKNFDKFFGKKLKKCSD